MGWSWLAISSFGRVLLSAAIYLEQPIRVTVGVASARSGLAQSATAGFFLLAKERRVITFSNYAETLHIPRRVVLEARKMRPILLSACACLMSATITRADIIPSGFRPIPHEVRLELGEFADRAWSAYTVESGDTLSAIALERLGKAERLAEILAANPGLEADELQVGQVLTLPPKIGQSSEGMHYFATVKWIGAANAKGLVPVADGDKLPATKWGSVLFAVPHAKLAVFEQWVTQGMKPPLVSKDKPDSKVGAVATDTPELDLTGILQEEIPVRHLVPDDEPARRLSTQVRVTGIDGEHLRYEAITTRLDQQGQPISALARHAPHVALASCGLLGLAALLLLSPRRAR